MVFEISIPQFWAFTSQCAIYDTTHTHAHTVHKVHVKEWSEDSTFLCEWLDSGFRPKCSKVQVNYITTARVWPSLQELITRIAYMVTDIERYTKTFLAKIYFHEMKTNSLENCIAFASAIELLFSGSPKHSNKTRNVPIKRIVGNIWCEEMNFIKCGSSGASGASGAGGASGIGGF